MIWDKPFITTLAAMGFAGLFLLGCFLTLVAHDMEKGRLYLGGIALATFGLGAAIVTALHISDL